MRNKYLSLIFLLILTFTASIIGSYITSIYKEPWYSTLVLPKISPPSWVFAPVWSTLYILMSVAIWKVWIKNFNKQILSLYLVHLFFNATWSIIFFGFHRFSCVFAFVGCVVWDSVTFAALGFHRLSCVFAFLGCVVWDSVTFAAFLARSVPCWIF